MMNEHIHFDMDCIVCPACLELLTRDDIEVFRHCPYCDYALKPDQALEQFLMKPVVEEWIRQNRAIESGGAVE